MAKIITYGKKQRYALIIMVRKCGSHECMDNCIRYINNNNISALRKCYSKLLIEFDGNEKYLDAQIYDYKENHYCTL